MTCDCQSYNRPDVTGSRQAVIVGAGADAIAVDACIAGTVGRLRDMGVRTTHSCCGHNGLFGDASLGVADVPDLVMAAAALAGDGRKWRLFVDPKPIRERVCGVDEDYDPTWLEEEVDMLLSNADVEQPLRALIVEIVARAARKE